MEYTTSEKTYNYRGYLSIFSGQLISIFGSSIASFVIVWWITISTGSAFLLTLSALAVVLPQIIFSSFFGPLIDRWNRKVIIFVTDLMQAFLSLVTMLIIFFNIEIGFLLIILFIRGTFGSMQTPALWSIIPQMVPPDKLSKVNSLRSLTISMVSIVSPIVSAILLTFIPIYNIILFDVITFAGSLIPLLLIGIPEYRVKSNGSDPKPKYKTQLIEGFTFLKTRNGLIPLLFSFAGVNVMLTSMSLMPLLVYSEHNGSAGDLSYVLASIQVGILVTSLAFTLFFKLNKLIFGVIFGIYGLLSSVVIIGLAPNGFIEILMFGNFIGGVFLTIASISSNTLWQKIVPGELQGRINSLRSTFAGLAQPIGYILVGLLAEIIPISNVYVIFGISGIIIFTLFLIFTSIRFIDYNTIPGVENLVETENKSSLVVKTKKEPIPRN